jgi:hypothetical protein
VDRLLYGDRADPYAALSRLGRRLEASLAPETVLPTVVEAVGQALKVPAVAIELERDGRFEVAAKHGSAPGRPAGRTSAACTPTSTALRWSACASARSRSGRRPYGTSARG